MAVDKRVAAAAILGVAAFVVAVVLVGRIRADRADARVAEIFGEAEVEYTAYLREAYRPLVRELDDGGHRRPDGEVDVRELSETPRIEEWCDKLIDIELEALDGFAAVSGARDTETRIRGRAHIAFLHRSADYAYLGALYDEGMIDQEPSAPPHDDQLPDSTDFMNLIIQSDGQLNGTEVGLTNNPVSILVLPECVLTAIDGRLATQ